ncbi:MAG: RNA polymerase sigma factor [Marinifilaceae bacterium]
MNTIIRNVMKEEQFLAGVNTKQLDAWKKLYQLYYPVLCGYARKYITNEEAIQDITQNIMIRLWESNSTFTHINALKSYLYKLLINDCLKYIRNRDIESRHINQLQEEHEHCEELIKNEQLFFKLHEVISSLPPKCKDIIISTLEGKSVEETAIHLNMGINSVKKYKKEAYRLIRLKVDYESFILYLNFKNICIF